MRIIVRTNEISQVRYYSKVFTDYLSINYTDGTQSRWSVNHYEESMTQRERCKELKTAYEVISCAIRAEKEFIEFYLDD